MLTLTRRNTLLGIALGERSALVAEVAANGGRPRVVRSGEFAYPEGVGLTQPEALGEALGRFLRERGFSGTTAVVGIPAKWVLTRNKEVPPADPRFVVETLLLQAETDFSGKFEDLAYDYAGQTSADRASSVMLMAIPRRHLRRVTDLATAARLKVAAVAPYAATLGASSAKSRDEARALLLGPGGAEFVAHNRVHPRVIRYLGSPHAPAAALAGELRRAATGMSVDDDGEISGDSSGAELVVWNDAGLDPAAVAALGDATGVRWRAGDLKDLGVDAGAGTDRRFATPVTLAVAGLGPPGAVPVDFLHPRLVRPKQARVGRRAAALAAAGVVLVAVTAFGAWDLRSRQAAVDQVTAEVNKRKDRVKEAEAFVAKVSFARGWQGGNPRFLACLRDVTAAVPEDGQTYLTSFSLHDDLKGGLGGKTADDDHALALLDRLRATGRFADVNLSYDARGSGKGGREVTFTVTFEYVPGVGRALPASAASVGQTRSD